MLDEVGLAHELPEPPGPQVRVVLGVVVGTLRGIDGARSPRNDPVRAVRCSAALGGAMWCRPVVCGHEDLPAGHLRVIVRRAPAGRA